MDDATKSSDDAIADFIQRLGPVHEKEPEHCYNENMRLRSRITELEQQISQQRQQKRHTPPEDCFPIFGFVGETLALLGKPIVRLTLRMENGNADDMYVHTSVLEQIPHFQTRLSERWCSDDAVLLPCNCSSAVAEVLVLRYYGVPLMRSIGDLQLALEVFLLASIWRCEDLQPEIELVVRAYLQGEQDYAQLRAYCEDFPGAADIVAFEAKVAASSVMEPSCAINASEMQQTLQSLMSEDDEHGKEAEALVSRAVEAGADEVVADALEAMLFEKTFWRVGELDGHPRETFLVQVVSGPRRFQAGWSPCHYIRRPGSTRFLRLMIGFATLCPQHFMRMARAFFGKVPQPHKNIDRNPPDIPVHESVRRELQEAFVSFLLVASEFAVSGVIRQTDFLAIFEQGVCQVEFDARPERFERPKNTGGSAAWRFCSDGDLIAKLVAFQSWVLSKPLVESFHGDVKDEIGTVFVPRLCKGSGNTQSRFEKLTDTDLLLATLLKRSAPEMQEKMISMITSDHPLYVRSYFGPSALQSLSPALELKVCKRMVESLEAPDNLFYRQQMYVGKLWPTLALLKRVSPAGRAILCRALLPHASSLTTEAADEVMRVMRVSR